MKKLNFVFPYLLVWFAMHANGLPAGAGDFSQISPPSDALPKYTQNLKLEDETNRWS